MKRIISLLLCALLLSASVLALFSCGAPKDLGAKISVYLGEGVYDLDPTAYAVSDNAGQVISLLYEPLFTINAKNRLGKAAAKSYKIDKKERRITVTLRESYWSDGVRLTADDYLYAWREVLLEPNHVSPAAALLYDIENAVAVKSGEADLYDLGVSAEGYELTITYREGADPKQLLRNLASVYTAPLRRDAVAKGGDFWSKKLSLSVSNGPFAVSMIDDEGGSFVLTRNEGYHQSPDVKNVTTKVTPHQLVSFTFSGETKTLTYDDVKNRVVFFLSDAPASDRSANAKKATAVDTLSAYTYVFNTERAPFNNAAVRSALLKALPREEIAEALVFAKAATGLLPESVLDLATGKSIRKKNEILSSSAELDAAKALLAGLSLSEEEKSFTLTVSDNEDERIIAQFAKAAWEELGFSVTVDAVGYVSESLVDVEDSDKTKKAYFEAHDAKVQVLVADAAQGKRDFDVIGFDMNFYSKDPFVGLAQFAKKYSGNGASFDAEELTEGSETLPPIREKTARPFFNGWQSDEYDALIDKAFAATDKKERSAALRDAENLLIREAVVCPVVFNQNYAFTQDLSRVSTDGAGNFVLTRTKQRNYRKYLDED